MEINQFGNELVFYRFDSEGFSIDLLQNTVPFRELAYFCSLVMLTHLI